MSKTNGDRAAGVVIAVSVVLLAALLPLALAKVIPAYSQTYLGWKPLVVRSDSMEDSIRQGAVILVYAAGWDTIEVGDVITFETRGGGLNTHRAVAIEDGKITTKGDNAPVPDPGFVTPDSYRYKVIRVYNGMAWAGEHRGVAAAVAAAPLAFIVAGAVAFVLRGIKRRGGTLSSRAAEKELDDLLAMLGEVMPFDGDGEDDWDVWALKQL